MVPIIGKVHLAYLPIKKVVGISKLARTVDIFCQKTSNSRDYDSTNSKFNL